MVYVNLRKKIKDLVSSKSTLLWLEGSQYEQVQDVHMKGSTVVLSLCNGTLKLIQFERYTLTLVGIQFWCRGKPGVLYKWELPGDEVRLQVGEISIHPDDDPNPPHIAA